MGIGEKWDALWEMVNRKFGNSRVGTYFDIKGRRSKLTTELRAGTVTFLTTAYILSVNALIVTDSGGPCTAADCLFNSGDDNCVMPQADGTTDPGYMACLNKVRTSLVSATAISSLIGSAMFGLGANLPLAAAPGMGLNAYFAYNVVGFRGSGNVTYETALAAVFVEGCIFVILAVTGVRARLIKMVPHSIMLATSAGIGLYLAFIGLQRSEGINLIAFDPTTLVTLGGCAASHFTQVYVIDESMVHNNTIGQLPVPTTVKGCSGGKMQSGSLWLGIFGLILIAILTSRSFKGSIIAGIAVVTVVAWIPGHAASYLGSSSAIPGGQARLEYFEHVVEAPSVKETALKLSFSQFVSGELWIALVTFLYIDFLDTTGTLFSMANFLNQYIPGFVGAQRQFEKQTFAFCVDGCASVVGSLLGTSPVAAFIESAAGIREGGRTGITALVVAFFMFCSLFFAPILASVPPYAVGPALITVGALMMMNVVKIKWEVPAESLPAFLTIILMPLTYSIAYGIIGGLVCYIIIYHVNMLLDRISDVLHWRSVGTDTQVPVMAERSFSGPARAPSFPRVPSYSAGAAVPSPRAPRHTNGLPPMGGLRSGGPTARIQPLVSELRQSVSTALASRGGAGVSQAHVGPTNALAQRQREVDDEPFDFPDWLNSPETTVTLRDAPVRPTIAHRPRADSAYDASLAATLPKEPDVEAPAPKVPDGEAPTPAADAEASTAHAGGADHQVDGDAAITADADRRASAEAERRPSAETEQEIATGGVDVQPPALNASQAPTSRPGLQDF